MSASPPRRLLLRRVAAVLGGLLVTVILSVATDAVMHGTGVFPPPGRAMSDALFLLATAYRIVFGVAGGWVAAWLAPDKPTAHAVALGLVGLLISIAGTVATWNAGPAFGPHWYPIALVLVSVPCAWAGGKLVRERPTSMEGRPAAA